MTDHLQNPDTPTESLPFSLMYKWSLPRNSKGLCCYRGRSRRGRIKASNTNFFFHDNSNIGADSSHTPNTTATRPRLTEQKKLNTHTDEQ